MNHNRHVSLLGLMGSGKSTIGARLAHALGRTVIDTDAYVIEAHGPIGDIFAREGEAAFRAYEYAALQRALAQPAAIISPGGGAVTHAPSRALLAHTTRIYLDVPIAVLVRRLAHSSVVRPLVGPEPDPKRLVALLEARRAWYEEAELRIDGDRPIDEIVAELRVRLRPAGTNP